MKYSNTHNIPAYIVRAITRPTYRRVGNISVTELIDPPQLRYLKIKHDKDIVKDVSDELPSFYGTALHDAIYCSDDPDALREKRLSVECRGWTVTGKVDRYKDGIITDHKFTSVWAYILGGKDEWEMQLNFYALLFRENGYEVTGLRQSLFFRDWKKREWMYGEDYPPPYVGYDAPLWEPEATWSILENRVTVHQQAEQGQFLGCTDKERWRSPAKYAVTKKGNKKASRLLPSLPEAEEWKKKNHHLGVMDIEKRNAEATRCEFYCPVKDFCKQYKGEGDGTLQGVG